MSVQLAALATVAVVFGAALQGTAGLGFSLIAGPALLALDPSFVPGPVLVALLTLVVLQSVRDGGFRDSGGLRWALAGRVPGTAVGVTVLHMLSSRVLGLLAGIVVLASVLAATGSLSVRRARGSLLAAGFVSGITETTSSIGGPPLALLYRRESPDMLRGTMSVFFLAGVSLSLVALVVGGQFGPADAAASLVLVPGTVAGFLVSKPLTGLCDGWATQAVLVLSTLCGVVAIVRQFL